MQCTGSPYWIQYTSQNIVIDNFYALNRLTFSTAYLHCWQPERYYSAVSNNTLYDYIYFVLVIVVGVAQSPF